MFHKYTSFNPLQKGSIAVTSGILIFFFILSGVLVAQEKAATIVERTSTIQEREERVASQAKPDHVAAIFIANRAGAHYDDKVLFFEDLVVSRITDLGFTIISREAVVEAVSGYGGGEADPENELDQRLADNTSALALARNLAASHIISVSLGTLNQTSRKFADTDGSYGGIATNNTRYTLRAQYKILDASNGGSLTADTLTVSKNLRQSEGLVVDDADIINQLLDEASQKIADSLSRKVQQGLVETENTKADLVSLSVSCDMSNMALPEIVEQENGSYAKTEKAYPIEPLNVTVEIDGMVVGTAPGTFEVRPGISKIRLSREGFREWSRTINIYNGQSLHVSLDPQDALLKRWRTEREFLEKISNQSIITKAEAARLHGIAKMYEQSGYKIDFKVDADEFPDIEINENSLVR